MPPVNEKEVMDKIDKIMSSRQFSYGNGGGMLQKIGHWLQGAVGDMVDFFKWISGSFSFKGNGSSNAAHGIANASIPLMKVMGLCAIAVVLAVLFRFVVINIRRSGSFAGRIRKRPFEMLKDWQGMYGNAVSCYESGDFSQALRFLFIAALLRLNEEGFLKIEKSKTNSQYMDELDTAGYDGYPEMKRFAVEFERCRYGRMETDGGIFDKWHGMFARLFGGGAR